MPPTPATTALPAGLAHLVLQEGQRAIHCEAIVRGSSVTARWYTSQHVRGRDTSTTGRSRSRETNRSRRRDIDSWRGHRGAPARRSQFVGLDVRSAERAPRSADSNIASARTPSARRIRTDTPARYRALSPSPTSAVDARLTLRPPFPGNVPVKPDSLRRAGDRVAVGGDCFQCNGALMGSGTSNASVSAPSVTAIRTRRCRLARNGVECDGLRLPCVEPHGLRGHGPDTRTASRLRIVTTASPARPVLFVTMAPNDARSPDDRNRGNAGSIVSGLVARISVSAAPKCDYRSPATAMMRYVVSESGNVTVVAARPAASVVTEPSQKTSERKSRRIAPGSMA